MEKETQLDIRIESKDPDVVRAVESALQPLKPSRQEPHRELVTILTVVATSVTLAKNLIELWKTLQSRHDPPAVRIEVESGAVLNITGARSEAEIQEFVAQSKGK